MSEQTRRSRTVPTPGGPAGIPRDVIDALPSPSLVIDVPTADRNIAIAADVLNERGLGLRPHFKAHKCVPLLRRQLATGFVTGVTCATGAEADVLARNGFTDILVANEVVDRTALSKVLSAATQTSVTIAVDAQAHVALLNGVVPSEMVLGVVIEVDTGYHRCGVPVTGDHLVELAEAIVRSERLHFAGLIGYEGHAVLEQDRGERVRLVDEAARILTIARDALAARGVSCEIVSGGGTGTFDLWPEGGPLTEVQAGSYVLMDATYGGLDLPFSNALFCLSRVVSRWGDRGVGDAGLKSMSKEYGLPTLLGPGHVTGLADEHVLFQVDAKSRLGVGDHIWLVPSHVDPTMNLHQRVFAWEPSVGIQEWTVSRDR